MLHICGSLSINFVLKPSRMKGLLGASWGFGKRARGQLPVFMRKKVCPGQLPSGIAKTLKGSKIFNTLQRLAELFTRAQRFSNKPCDRQIFHRTAKRVCAA